MKERKQQTLYISRKDNSAELKKTIEMNEHSLPETVFTTFEFSGVCNHAEHSSEVREFLLINNAD